MALTMAKSDTFELKTSTEIFDPQGIISGKYDHFGTMSHQYMIVFGYTGGHIQAYTQHIWTIYGLYMVIYGHIRSYMAIYGHIWPYMAVYGRICPYMVIYRAYMVHICCVYACILSPVSPKKSLCWSDIGPKW